MATSSLRHNSQNEWRASVAFYNLGLAGNAFDGKNWTQGKNHRRVLLRIFKELLQEKKNTLGLFLNEVGNWSNFLTLEGRMRLEEVLTEAFESAGATQHVSRLTSHVSRLTSHVSLLASHLSPWPTSDPGLRLTLAYV